MCLTELCKFLLWPVATLAATQTSTSECWSLQEEQPLASQEEVGISLLTVLRLTLAVFFPHRLVLA